MDNLRSVSQIQKDCKFEKLNTLKFASLNILKQKLLPSLCKKQKLRNGISVYCSHKNCERLTIEGR